MLLYFWTLYSQNEGCPGCEIRLSILELQPGQFWMFAGKFNLQYKMHLYLWFKMQPKKHKTP